MDKRAKDARAKGANNKRAASGTSLSQEDALRRRLSQPQSSHNPQVLRMYKGHFVGVEIHVSW